MRVSRHLVKAEELEEFYMLVSAKEMLEKAVEGHYAVGQFNINNLEWTKAILLTAEECKSPVILGVSAVSYTHLTLPTTSRV